jgi:hypothetical protein
VTPMERSENGAFTPGLRNLAGSGNQGLTLVPIPTRFELTLPLSTRLKLTVSP